MHLCVRWSRRTIEPRCSTVCFGTGFFTIVAADAQGFIDEQDVGCFAQALLHEEGNKITGFGRRFHAQVFTQPLLNGFLYALPQAGIALEHLIKYRCVEEH